jgi:hypothetical protein
MAAIAAIMVAILTAIFQHFHISRSALWGRGTISLYVVTGSI